MQRASLLSWPRALSPRFRHCRPLTAVMRLLVRDVELEANEVSLRAFEP